MTVVYNPAQPAPLPGLPTRLVLREDLSIGHMEGREEDMLLEPIDIDADDEGNIYILDRKALHIKVYDSRGQLVRTIGKKGQGPANSRIPRIFKSHRKKKLFCATRPSGSCSSSGRMGHSSESCPRARCGFSAAPRLTPRVMSLGAMPS